MRLRLRVCLLAALALPAAPSLAQERTYVGPHPIDLAGGWHLEGGLHTHAPLAIDDAPFVTVDGVSVFLADPGAYGWTGDVWIHRGTHPLPGGLAGYCAIEHEHAHPFAPEGRAFRRSSDGVYAYVGALRGGRPMARPARMAPARPIELEAPAIATPFWFGGCLHRRRGDAVAPLFECEPFTPFVSARAPAASAPPPPARRGYGTFESRPAVGAPRTRAGAQ